MYERTGQNVQLLNSELVSCHVTSCFGWVGIEFEHLHMRERIVIDKTLNMMHEQVGCDRL